MPRLSWVPPTTPKTAEQAKLSKHMYKVQGTGADDQPNWMDFYYGEQGEEQHQVEEVETTTVELVREDGLVQGNWREAAAAAWASEAEVEVEEAGAVTGWDASAPSSGVTTAGGPTTETNGLQLLAQYSDSE